MTIREILATYRRIAVVGLSNRASMPSHYVSEYMIAHGYEITPVNPHADEVLGLPCYPSLTAVPTPVPEIVNIFRRSDQVGPIVDEAIRVGAKVIWMQMGIYDEAAAERARAAGLEVIQGQCIKVEHAMLGLGRVGRS